MKFEKHVVIINSRKTYYWEAGGMGKPVMVFLHGFPGNHSGLLDLVRGFGENYRMIIPDMPACGQSESLQGLHVLENYAAWLAALLEQLNAGAVIMVGHSFGARVALVFAGIYPKNVEKLVLIAPVLKVEGLVARLASLKFSVAKLLPARLQKPWLKNPLYQTAVRVIIFKSASKKRREAISAADVKELKTLDVRATIEIFDEFYYSDLMLLAKRVVVPCLVIAGDKDEIAPLASLRVLAGNFPNAMLDIMKSSGHLVPLERPRATAKIICNWLMS